MVMDGGSGLTLLCSVIHLTPLYSYHSLYSQLVFFIQLNKFCLAWIFVLFHESYGQHYVVLTITAF